MPAAVTFLLTDIEGSTRLWEHQPEAMRRINARHDELVEEVVTAHNGSIVRSRAEGDSAFATFVDAADGVRGAIALQNAVDAEPWADGIEVRVRMALHTGAAPHAGDQLYGPVVNRCARLRGIGHGRQTLLSGATAALVGDALPPEVSLVDLGVHRLKDLSEPEHVFQVDHPSLARDFPPLRSLDAAHHNVPQPIERLVGQVEATARVVGVVTDAPLVTLTGVGGIGKTRLAVEVATAMIETFAGGVWLVELAVVSTADLVAQAIATAVGVRDQPGRPLLETVGDHIRSKPTLLVLDNCEHLLPDVARIVEQLLRAAPGTHVLATSRESLGVAGEKVWRVDPMARDDATELFVARAGLAAAPSGEDVALIGEICDGLDGIPLAVQMAAAAASDGMSLEDVRRGLSGVDSLRATIAWSHKLLDDDERCLFRRLACFVGGFSLDAAEGVCAAEQVGSLDEFAVLDLVARLVHKSLVVADTSGGRVRYRQLESIREFGAEALDDADESAPLRAQHLRWFLAIAEPVLGMQGDEYLAELDLLDLEHDNLRAALAWEGEGDDADLQVRLVGALAAFWQVRGFWTEGRRWLETVITRTPRPWSGRALALSQLGALLEMSGDHADAAKCYAEAGEAYEYLTTIVDDATITRQIEYSVVWLTLRRGELARIAGDDATAESLFVQARDVSERGQFGRERASALTQLGVLAMSRCRWADAAAFLADGVHAFRAVGAPGAAAAAMCALADVLRFQGDFDAAIALYGEARVSAQALQDARTVDVARNGRVDCRLAMGEDCSSELAEVEEMLVAARARGDRTLEANTLDVMARIRRAAGDTEAAVAAHALALAIFRETAAGYTVAFALHELGRSQAAAGQAERARACLDEASAIARQLGNETMLGAIEADLTAM